MTTTIRAGWLPFMLLATLAACAGDAVPQVRASSSSGARSSAPPAIAHGAASSAGSAVPGGPAAVSGNAAQAGGAAGRGVTLPVGMPDDCDEHPSFKPEGCPCRAGETAACWTGTAADRKTGTCHDGLQICSGSSEFASWGPCMGEQKACGSDAGVPPPPPPPNEDCACVPGAVIQCSEDCTVGIICSLTATKTCLPDGTWSTCREDLGVQLDLPGIQCRNMLHGCFNLTTDMPASNDGELYVGDCSKQFKCGHAPLPVQQVDAAN